MNAFSVSLAGDLPAKLLRLLAELENPVALNHELGQRLAGELRAHFQRRNADGPRNKLGAPSSNFWNRIRDSVGDPETNAAGGSVTIADPAITQKIYGGPIHMLSAMLAIPARVEAYNKSPRLFANLKAVFFPSGAIALVSRETSSPDGRKRIGPAAENGLIYYWLVRQTRPQAADPNALPAPEKLAAALADTAEKYLNRILNN